MKFGELVRRKRLEKGYSVRKLAKLCNIGASSISRWENGKIDDIKFKHVKVLKKILDLNADEVFMFEEDESEE